MHLTPLSDPRSHLVLLRSEQLQVRLADQLAVRGAQRPPQLLFFLLVSFGTLSRRHLHLQPHNLCMQVQVAGTLGHTVRVCKQCIDSREATAGPDLIQELLRLSKLLSSSL